jgi:hypothetical protein
MAMSEAMTNETGDDGPSDTVRTNVEVDRQLWRQVRAAAITDGQNVSEKLEEILREKFEGHDTDTNNADDDN